MSEGRQDAFTNGAYSASPEAHFTSLQQGAGSHGFTPTSTLEENHVLVGANGMSQADRNRQPIKGPGMSINGQSDDTFQTHMWMGNSSRTYGG